MRLDFAIGIFLVAIVLPGLWHAWRFRRGRLPVTITADPDDPRPTQLADCFSQVAQRLDERPQRMALVVDARNRLGRSAVLDFAPDGTMVVSVDGHRPKRFSLRRRWIAEHPVPLVLWSPGRPKRLCRLFIDPVDANRFRVTERPRARFPMPIAAACSVVGAFGAYFVIPELLALAGGLAVGYVLDQRLRR